ncbi:MAG: YraN family protein [Nitrospinota bacterium]
MGRERLELGKRGEAFALTFLTSRGYTIVEKNFRCPLGEIDIIAKDGIELAFVEVRTKSSLEFGTPLDSVTIKKQEQVRKLAAYYLHTKKIFGVDCRFDVVSVIKTGETFEAEVIQGAF